MSDVDEIEVGGHRDVERSAQVQRLVARRSLMNVVVHSVDAADVVDERLEATGSDAHPLLGGIVPAVGGLLELSNVYDLGPVKFTRREINLVSQVNFDVRGQKRVRHLDE